MHGKGEIIKQSITAKYFIEVSQFKVDKKPNVLIIKLCIQVSQQRRDRETSLRQSM